MAPTMKTNVDKAGESCAVMLSISKTIATVATSETMDFDRKFEALIKLAQAGQECRRAFVDHT